MKLVKFIKHCSQTKPLSPKQLKRWKEEEQKIIRNILDSMDSDLDYLTQMKDAYRQVRKSNASIPRSVVNATTGKPYK